MSFKVSTIFEFDSFIALDIGAFKIKVLVCRVENGEVKIIGSASTRQSRKDMLWGEISDLHAVSDAIAKTIYKATEWIEQVPNDIIVGLNTTNMLYDTLSMNYVRQDSTAPITMNEIDEVISGTEQKSLDRLRGKIETCVGIVDCEMKPITTMLTAIYLDGQKVTNPVGFTGKNIKLNLLNVFAPISRFNIVRNIMRDLEKNVVSIVPFAISLPKLIESSSYYEDANLIIDFGYTKTTVVVQSKWETLGLHTLPFGLSYLEDALRKDGHGSYLDTEKFLWDLDMCQKKHPKLVDDIFSVLLDGIFVAVLDIIKQAYFKNIFISGVTSTPAIREKIAKYFAGKQWEVLPQVIDLLDVSTFAKESKLERNSWAGVASLAITWRELLSTKKDPIARILRYVIYKYE